MIAIKETIMGKANVNVTVIVDYNAHTTYSIIDSLQICTKTPVGNMAGKCLPSDTKYIGELSLGDGSLVADSWYLELKST